MLGKKQFHVDLAGFTDSGRVCENLHAFLNLVVAGSNKMVDSLHFYNADTAGTDLVDIISDSKDKERENHCRGRRPEFGFLLEPAVVYY